MKAQFAQAAIFEILLDGEPHKREEVIVVARPLVDPALAARRWLGIQRNRKRKGAFTMTAAEAVDPGSRQLVAELLRTLIKKGIVLTWEDKDGVKWLQLPDPLNPKPRANHKKPLRMPTAENKYLVLSFLAKKGNKGATDSEIEDWSESDYHFRRERKTLEREGWIEDSGEKRVFDDRSFEQTVWVLTKEGRERWRRRRSRSEKTKKPA